MESKVRPSFWQKYNALPVLERFQVDRAFLLWQNDPNYPALRFKPVIPGHPPIYSVRIMNTGYRALCELKDGAATWFWIGPHDEYDRLLKSWGRR